MENLLHGFFHNHGSSYKNDKKQYGQQVGQRDCNEVNQNTFEPSDPQELLVHDDCVWYADELIYHTRYWLSFGYEIKGKYGCPHYLIYARRIHQCVEMLRQVERMPGAVGTQESLLEEKKAVREHGGELYAESSVELI